MEQVSSEIKPLKEWMLGFYSNGDKTRPPGFFQQRIKADDDRHQRLLEIQADQTKTLNEVKTYVDEQQLRHKVEAERKEKLEKRIAFWAPYVKWAAAGLFAGIVAIGGWTLTKAVPFAMGMYHEYLREHPAVVRELGNQSQSSDPSAYAGGNESAHAEAPKQR